MNSELSLLRPQPALEVGAEATSQRHGLSEVTLPLEARGASGFEVFSLLDSASRGKMLGGVHGGDIQHLQHDYRAEQLRGTATYPRSLHMRHLGGQQFQYLLAEKAVVRDFETPALLKKYRESQGKKASDIQIVTSPKAGIAQLEASPSFKEHTGLNLEQVAAQAYADLFLCLEELNMQPLRIWNYVPDINQGADAQGNGSSERYKQFNAGRHQAWLAANSDFSQVCAATGIGNLNTQDELQLTVLATKHPVVHLDNPHQTPFLQYDSEKFGVQPCSRRGTIHLPPTGFEVYIAGTASITGQENRHAGDNEPKNIRLQTKQTLDNIRVLISQKNLEHHLIEAAVVLKKAVPIFQLSDLQAVRVYIRNEEDLPIIKEEMELAGIDLRQSMFVQADICRRPLDVEIEGMVSCL